MEGERVIPLTPYVAQLLSVLPRVNEWVFASPSSDEEMETVGDCCFLCGAQAGAITQEHVFPKWLQQRYDLWTQRLGLLNDTEIQYRGLRIPCCSTCNSEDLSRLEAAVSSAVASGHEACIALDERLLYLWAGKLFYVSKVAGRKLHPIQFDELYAKVTYQVSLVEGGVTYLTSQVTEGQHPARTDVLGGGSLREWSQEDFSQVLCAHVSAWLKSKGKDTQWFAPPNLVPTWMIADTGELLLQPLSSWEHGAALDT